MLAPAIEVVLSSDSRVTLASYTAVLDEVRLALTEVDRHRLPGRHPRLDWAIQDIGGKKDLRIVLSPTRIPRQRDAETLGWSSEGLVAGISQLEERPVIPDWFSETTVERVQRVGKHIDRGRINHVEIASRHEHSVINDVTIRRAREAVKPATTTWGSVFGRLEELVARSGSNPRAVIYPEGSRRAVRVRASSDQIGQLREAWGQRVLAGGQLMRNSVGQPIRLELTEIQVLPVRDSLTARDLLGIAPGATGSMTTAEYIDELRNG